MTYIEAAIAVLKARGKPMTAKEITEQVLRQGMIRSAGKTPLATMSAELYTYTRDAKSPVIRRDYQPGLRRAVRGSVRWRHVV
jgi:hypothetical protein